MGSMKNDGLKYPSNHDMENVHDDGDQEQLIQETDVHHNLTFPGVHTSRLTGQLSQVDPENFASGGDVRRKKICIASRAPFVGGAELAMERLALGLQAQGHDVFFLLGKHGEVAERLEDAGLRCIHFPIQFTDKKRFWRYMGAKTSLRNLFKREKPDVLHANDLPSSQMVFDAARGLPISRVCHHRFVYDGKAINWFNKYPPDRHVFVSNALMSDLCMRSTQLASQSCSVVYDGLELPELPDQQSKMNVRDQLGLAQDKTIVTFAGQIIERKGVSELIQAWALLRDRNMADAQLVIVGDDLAGQGAYRQQMEQLSQLLNVDPKFVGFQKNVNQWLLASDIAVVPSHVEPLGNATLEAMSCGLPVIGADVGGIPEMIVNDKTGLLTPAKDAGQLADAIYKLTSDEIYRQQLGAAARKRCEVMFSLKAHTDAMLFEYSAAQSDGAGNTQLKQAA
jgi:glycosyltransferase involved in cell wall biosynthesis